MSWRHRHGASMSQLVASGRSTLALDNVTAHGGVSEVKRLLVIALASVALMLTVQHAATADPPATNKNADPLTFLCTRGTDVIQFQAVGIRQSAQIAGQVLTDHSVIVFVRLVVAGQIIFEVPGQAGRADLWSCAVLSNPGTFVDAFITPRR
jgi:hypothetical protein